MKSATQQTRPGLRSPVDFNRLAQGECGQASQQQTQPIGIPEERYPQIPDALDTQEKLVSMLIDAVQTLGQRLQPAIPPQPPSEDSGKPSEGRPLCQIAERLSLNNQRLSAAYNAITTLTALIEL